MRNGKREYSIRGHQRHTGFYVNITTADGKQYQQWLRTATGAAVYAKGASKRYPGSTITIEEVTRG